MADQYDGLSLTPEQARLAGQMGLTRSQATSWQKLGIGAAPPSPAPAPAIPFGPPPPPPEVYGPYQPNPGGANYQPNPALAGQPKARTEGPRNAALGNIGAKGGDPVAAAVGPAIKKAFSSSEPLFQSPLATPQSYAPGDGARPGEIGPPTDPRKDATFVDGEGARSFDSSLQGAPQVIDPGGRRPASWQIQEGMDLGPQASEAVNSADEHGRVAALADQTAAKRAQEFEADYLGRMNSASEKYALQENSRAEQFQKDYDDHMGKLDSLRGEIRSAAVDPYASGLSGMVGGKAGQVLGSVADSIAIGLGAFASKHGENAGLEAVRHRISTNLRAQEEQLGKLERGAKGEMNFLGMLKQKFGDLGQAKAAAHIAYIEAAKSELAKQIGSPEVADPRLLAAGERINAKLDDDLVNRLAHFNGITRDRVVRHDIMAPPRVIGGPAVSTEAKHDARYLSESYEKAGIPAALSQLKDVDRTIDALGDGEIGGVGWIEGIVPNRLSPKQWVAARQAVQSVKNAIGHSIFGGALSPTEGEKLNEQLDGAKDTDSLRRTVQAYRQALQHRSANIAAGASPDGVDLYEQRGGSVQRGAPSQRQIALQKPAAPYVKEAK